MKPLRIAGLIAVPIVAVAALWIGFSGSDPVLSGTVIPPPPALKSVGAVPIPEKLPGGNDVSGIGFSGDHLYLVSDETAHVEVLKKSGDVYLMCGTVPLGVPEVELDLEAIAIDSGYVYTIGSHSWARPKQRAKESYADNRLKLEQLAPPGARDVLARFRPNPDGSVSQAERVSLRTAIDADPVLRPFAGLPGKENGVDIEGLAVKGKDVFVGFRSPVLRENYVPVMRTSFSATGEHDLRFVNLGGRGVRDLVAVEKGFLILAGPPGEGPGSYQIYFWDGNDCLTGASPEGRCELLTEVPASDKGKPEGLTVTGEDAKGYDLVLASDGAANGAVTRYRLAKKR